MHRHDRAKVAAGQWLADLAAGFAAYLVGRGYAKSSVDHHLYLMADLSAWLAGRRVELVFDPLSLTCDNGSYADLGIIPSTCHLPC